MYKLQIQACEKSILLLLAKSKGQINGLENNNSMNRYKVHQFIINIKLALYILYNYVEWFLTLKDTTKASGTHSFTKGSSILGTSCRESCNGPSADWILCSGCKHKQKYLHMPYTVNISTKYL